MKNPPPRKSPLTIKAHPKQASITQIRCMKIVVRKASRREVCLSHHRPTDEDRVRVATVVEIPLNESQPFRLLWSIEDEIQTGLKML